MITLRGKRVFLACEHIDMRGGIDVLVKIVKSNFNLDPFNGAIFVFCNRVHDRVKLVEWDQDGFWMYYKRLERGKFEWPLFGEEKSITMTGEELSYLLSGVKYIDKGLVDGISNKLVIEHSETLAA